MPWVAYPAEDAGGLGRAPLLLPAAPAASPVPKVLPLPSLCALQAVIPWNLLGHMVDLPLAAGSRGYAASVWLYGVFNQLVRGFVRFNGEGNCGCEESSKGMRLKSRRCELGSVFIQHTDLFDYTTLN